MAMGQISETRKCIYCGDYFDPAATRIGDYWVCSAECAKAMVDFLNKPHADNGSLAEE